MNISTVSFYMTVYNGLPFVRQSVKSMQEQTHTDWEAVIVDDGSTDETVKYLQQIKQEDSRFKIYSLDKIGRGAALNYAVKKANGIFLCNLDADDLAHPNRLEYQLKLMENYKLDLLCSAAHVIKGSNPLEPLFEEVSYDNSIIDITHKICRKNPIIHSSTIVRRDVLEKVDGYKESQKSQLDYELWIRIVAAGYKLYKTNMKLSVKRVHDQQFFGVKKHYRYLLVSTFLQRKAIRTLNYSRFYYILSYLRFIYSLLPRVIRNIRFK